MFLNPSSCGLLTIYIVVTMLSNGPNIELRWSLGSREAFPVPVLLREYLCIGRLLTGTESTEEGSLLITKWVGAKAETSA
jgi:hypothetical protein